MPNLSQEELNELAKKYKDVKLERGVNQYLSKLLEGANDKPLMSLKEIKKELGIKDEHIAKMFGYANAHSYRTSKARDKMDKGMEAFYETIKINSMDINELKLSKENKENILSIWNELSSDQQRMVKEDIYKLDKGKFRIENIIKNGNKINVIVITEDGEHDYNYLG